jgi:futalosine hydrolase
MMRLLLIASTRQELEPLFNMGSHTKLRDNLWEWEASGFPPIQILISGVGSASTVFSVTEQLLTTKYDIALQAGICGAFDRSLKLGDVVVVEKDKFGQLGAEDDEQFMDVFELGLAERDTFPYQNGWLTGIQPIPSVCAPFQHVCGITNETSTGSEASVARLTTLYHPQTESMEGAGFFFAAAKCHTPALQIRSISNYVEKRNKANWNIPLAVEQLHRALTQLLPSLTV